jgi:Protein O-mannosyl-transferase TMEM260-like
MDYKRLNNYIGWMVLATAIAVYFMTLEPTTSLWDCGEYITTAYKLEVGHPPGAPLFMMLGRLFIWIGGDNPETAAYMINGMSALCSAFTILFLFWSITMLGKKIVLHPEVKLFGSESVSDTLDGPTTEKRTMTDGYKWAILGSGLIGALAYTFTDSFWFSAVEGEVYAMSSFFTAIVFWAILKWDSESQDKEDEPDNVEVQSKNENRWLVFIFFMIGLSIGVHLLNLLCIPVLAYVIYFRKFKKPTIGGFILTGVIGIAALGIIQAVIIPKTVEIAGWFERYFVNDMGMPFNSGAMVFLMLLAGTLITGVMVTRKKNLSDGLKYAFLGISGLLVILIVVFTAVNAGTVAAIVRFIFLGGALAVGAYLFSKHRKEAYETVAWSATMLFIGYSCFAMIVIRSNANTPLDENDPENLVSLQSYLQREQYGDWPILKGQAFNSDFERDQAGNIDYSYWDNRSDVYLRRFVVQSKDGKTEYKGYKTIEEAKAYAATVNGDVVEKYFQTFDGTHKKPTYKASHTMFFPRMYSSEARHVDGYKSWSGYDASDRVKQMKKSRAYKKTTDPREKMELIQVAQLPSMGENFSYMFNYQVNWMYWRYFMWNFSGRQSDEQGDGNPKDGNWISGFNFIDKHHIGDQTLAPSVITENPSHNKFYMLPLILGLIGFIFMATKATKGWWTVMLLFLLTGFAIIIYLNQKPVEPRERDYAYAASFYAFSIFIGFAVLALYDAFKNMQWKELLATGGTLIGIGLVFLVFGSTTGGVSFLYIGGIVTALLGLMIVLRNGLNDKMAGMLATIILLPVPIIMGMQGWDDHDRSDRYTAQALAQNYLMSCSDNSIVYTNGDNDTFPLWYLQEVEGYKTSVRVCNLSLLNTDWYTEQMTRKAYDSEPLPISFTEEQYRQNGTRDYVYVMGTNEISLSKKEIDAKYKPVIDLKIAHNPEKFEPAFAKASKDLYLVLGQTPFAQTHEELHSILPNFDSTNTYYQFRNLVMKLKADPDPSTDVNQAIIQQAKAIGQEPMLVNEFGLNGNHISAVMNVMITFNDAFDFMPADAAMAFLRDESNIERNPNSDQEYWFLPAKGLTVDVDKDKIAALANDDDPSNDVVSAEDLDRMVDRLEWTLPKQGLYKADLLIVDIAAHFNWDRNIYFASSASKSTYLGLDKYFFAEGLVYKLVPIEADKNRNPNSLGEVNKDKMYENLVENFNWGNMEKEEVLVDYYTRRLTNNYRVQFSVLADAYTEEIEEAEQILSVLDQIETQDGPPEQVVKTPMGDFVRSEIPAERAKAKNTIEENSPKVVAILDRSFEIMPEFNVPFGRVMPSYVQAYYVAGADDKAVMYSDLVLDKCTEELDYYLSLEPQFSNALIFSMYDSYRGIFSLWQSAQVHNEDEAYTTKMTENLVNYRASIEAHMIKMSKEGSASDKANMKGTFGAIFQQMDMMFQQ